MNKKILVIGCPGGGKSTFARALAERTGLPLVYLDMLFWNADKTTVAREVFRARLAEALAGEEWIIDGNYISTMEMRMEKCDTVFFLDYDVDVCISGIEARMFKPRPDMPWVETEPDEEFLAFVRDFARDSRPKILALLEKYKEKEIVVFKTREEAQEELAKAEMRGGF